MKTIIRIVVCIALALLIAFVAVPFAAKALLPIKYQDIILKYSGEYGVSPELVAGVIRAESSWNEKAKSKAPAMGLMQLTDETFKYIQKKLDEQLPSEQIYDPETNIKYGTYYLSMLGKSFSDERSVLAAYNAGPNKVSSWLKKSDYSDDGVRLKKIPYAETEKYVDKTSLYKKLYKYIYFSK